MLRSILSLRTVLILSLLIPLAACGEDENASEAEEPVVRGLKTILVQDEERSTVRKYPSVLQPASLSALSFEISGKLAEVELEVGQPVKKGDVLARIDPTILTLKVESAEAALRQAQSSDQIASEDNQRKATLLAKGVITRVAADQARNEAERARAELTQARKTLATTREDLTKAVLRAPFDGIVNTVSVDSFANVSAGNTVATIYSASSFEVSFSVSYDVINLLTVGKDAVIRLADDPTVVLDAHVSELGSRADAASSFPVVVTLDSASPDLKAGMAVEVTLNFAIEGGTGFALPLTVLSLEGKIKQPTGKNGPREAFVYVFDPETSTVKQRAVMIAGIRENALIVVDGLSKGERVAAAGVSFLRDGQAVKLLPDAAQD